MGYLTEIEHRKYGFTARYNATANPTLALLALLALLAAFCSSATAARLVTTCLGCCATLPIPREIPRNIKH
jgi:hypothetical protein